MENKFGEYLKNKRKKKNMSITEVSLLSNISIAQISRIENGKRGTPLPGTIKKFSIALEVPYEDLMIRAGYLEKVK